MNVESTIALASGGLWDAMVLGGALGAGCVAIIVAVKSVLGRRE